jgi:hypothetical protein
VPDATGSPPFWPGKSLSVTGADCPHHPHAEGLATPKPRAADDTDTPPHTNSKNRARNS